MAVGQEPAERVFGGYDAGGAAGGRRLGALGLRLIKSTR